MESYGLSVSLIYPIVKSIVLKGYALEAFCLFASFDRMILQDAEARIREEDIDHLLDAASVFTNDEQFGLHQGQIIEMSDLGILGYVLLHCKTLGQALDAFRRYNIILCNGIDVDWDTDEEDTVIRFKISNPARLASRHAVEGIVSSLYHVLVKLSCNRVPVKMLQFTHAAPTDKNEYLTILGVAPEFERETNLLYIEKGVMEYPILLSDKELLRTFESYAEEARNKLLYGRTYSDQVYRWIIHCMPSTFPTVKDAARNFNISIRTLQEYLKKEKTTYNILFNKARMELSIRYLNNPRFTVAEIAYLLHFSEPSAFQNAFKRWTGLPPGQFRKKMT